MPSRPAASGGRLHTAHRPGWEGWVSNSACPSHCGSMNDPLRWHQLREIRKVPSRLRVTIPGNPFNFIRPARCLVRTFRAAVIRQPPAPLINPLRTVAIFNWLRPVESISSPSLGITHISRDPPFADDSAWYSSGTSTRPQRPARFVDHVTCAWRTQQCSNANKRTRRGTGDDAQGFIASTA